jgi:transcriptional regulator with XRE-family HTH domain
MTEDEQKLAREIGLTLRRLRHDRGLTQQALAQRVAGGVDATYIGKIERGAQLPSLKVLLRLGNSLGIVVSEFFYPPPGRVPHDTSASLHLEPLLQALHNRGIDGMSLVRAILDAVGQHVLAASPQRMTTAGREPVVRPDSRTAIPLPMPESARQDD